MFNHLIRLDEDQLGLIVNLPFFLIVQGFIRFINFVKFFAVVIRIVQIFVGMVFYRQFPEGFLNLIRIRIEGDSQNIVVVVLSFSLILKIGINIFFVNVVFAKIQDEFFCSFLFIPLGSRIEILVIIRHQHIVQNGFLRCGHCRIRSLPNEENKVG